MLHLFLELESCSESVLASKESLCVVSTMSAILSVPRRRLKRKVWLGFEIVAADPSEDAAAQRPSTGSWAEFLVEDDLGEEDGRNSREVYLVTLPALSHANGLGASSSGLVCPSTWKHEDIARVMVHAFGHPVRAHNNSTWGGEVVNLNLFVVFRERHAPRPGEKVGPYHWHVAVKAHPAFRFASFKRALTVHHGLASHWSTSHTGYHSAVRYGAMPSLKKLRADLDPKPLAWARPDGPNGGKHPDLYDASQEPTTAAALKRRRENKVKDACEQGKPEPRPSEMDLYPIIVQQGFKNTPDDMMAHQKLIQHLKACGSPALTAFAFKNRRSIPGLIDDVWSWETVDDVLAHNAKTRMERLAEAAREPCKCGGRWRQLAEQCCILNGINISSLCSDIHMLLRDGRRADRFVLVLMGRFGGEGKSFWLAPLRSIFGEEHIQGTPQPGNFPLLDLEQKKLVLLDEWGFDESVVPLVTQLLWYEGKPFPITRPQNKDYSGHLLYRGSAPIFATCKEKDLGPRISEAQKATALGNPSENTMLLRRLRVYSLARKLPISPDETVSECGACFAQLVLRYSTLPW
jgi:hypothetical protein